MSGNNKTTEQQLLTEEVVETQNNTEIPPSMEPPKATETVVIKKGGSALGLLAILISLGLGGAGYYFGKPWVEQFQQKLTALEQKVTEPVTQVVTDDKLNFEQERNQIIQLQQLTEATQRKIATLEEALALKTQEISALQHTINRLNANTKPEQPNDWLLAEAEFLLNNSLRKLVLDNDVDTSIALLKVADETLMKVSDPRIINVRTAINQDLKQLLSVNSIDQNVVMQRLSQLASNIDELTVLDINFGDSSNNSSQLSDSISDWKANAEKSAISFLNHFIRISPKGADNRALLAPNQDIYLRENIRLRLQIAIMAVPRQQNELYKQSLETVAAWIRSYFDTSSEIAQDFLKNLDELAEQSIYVDLPTQLYSLTALDNLLNKQPIEVKKVEIPADKAVVEQAAQDQQAVQQEKTSQTEVPSHDTVAPDASQK